MRKHEEEVIAGMHFLLTPAEQRRVEIEVAAAHLLMINEGDKRDTGEGGAKVLGATDGEEGSLLGGEYISLSKF